jgi:hypothetical protein
LVPLTMNRTLGKSGAIAAVLQEMTMSLLQTIMRSKRALSEQRRSLREHVNFPAWIQVDPGSQSHECTVLDVSEDGARIMVPSSVRLPREFWFILSKSDIRRRRCRMVWRSNDQIGVFYLGPLQLERSSTILN